ncbi:DUF4258 domain-containing protein [Ancylobacter sp. WKF20]|uniref:DUF4258 domain-containing protein n=1 Tax=Ancylobacter sp. WKF20 TaxID=3039801 RepID=UPI00243425E4|nr:DUF4258 domain-containing protein [Ancylobacter sp. WKF20]WGD30412.1 DUF4258 domain-containing protein [Ancylobacter sp. WKF20]
MARLRFSAHILDVMEERSIEAEWVERTLSEPEWVEPDLADPGLRRAFRAIQERGDRILCVVYRDDGEALFAVTAFFDRGARRP